MAEVVDKLPEKRNHSKYSQFIVGRVWKLQEGVDFESVMPFQRAFRIYATRKGLKAMCRVVGEHLYIQAVPRSSRRK